VRINGPVLQGARTFLTKTRSGGFRRKKNERLFTLFSYFKIGVGRAVPTVGGFRLQVAISRRIVDL
jgi:hypothetical protein